LAQWQKGVYGWRQIAGQPSGWWCWWARSMLKGRCRSR
jgi:hypothetical protein